MNIKPIIMLMLAIALTGFAFAEVNDTNSTDVNNTLNTTQNITTNITDTNTTTNQTTNQTNTNTTTNQTTNTTTNQTTNQTNTNTTTNQTTNTTTNQTTNQTNTNTTTNQTTNTTTNQTNTNTTTNTTVESNIINSKALEVRYEHLVCKTDFTIGQIELIEEYLEDKISDELMDNLSENKEELEDAIAVLKKYANNTNKTAFDTYLEMEFRPLFQDTTQELNAIKRNFKQYNLSNDTRAEIITELKGLQKEYSECNSDKEIKMAKVMERHIENWNKQWTNMIERMQRKGLDTTEMEALRKQIYDQNQELHGLIFSGNGKIISQYMKEYRNEHIKYSTKMEVAKLKSYKYKLEKESKGYDITKRSESITKKIEYVEKYSENNEKGKKYDNEKEMKDKWNNIREANKEMKEMSKEILKERMKEQSKNKTKDNSNGRGRN